MNTRRMAPGRALLLGASFLVLLYLIVPVLIVIPMSFSDSRFLQFPPQSLSLRWYARFFASVDWYTSMIVSTKVAVLTTLISVPLGVAAAYAIHTSTRPIVRAAHSILMLPMLVPGIVVAIGVFYLYVKLGVVGTIAGLVAAHTMLALPFVVVTVISAFRTSDMSQELIARSLGCGQLQAFFAVTFVQIRGSVVIAALFAFITSFDEVIVSLFVSRGVNITLTKVMFDTLHDEIDPTIAAVSSMLILLSVFAACGAMALERQSRLSESHH